MNVTDDENLRHENGIDLTETGEELKFVFWNIEGLRNKIGIYDLKMYLKQFDILGLTETWTEENAKYEIEGFQGILKSEVREARKGRHPGGIAIFYKNYLKKYIQKIESSLKEVLWIVLKKGKLNLLIGTVYLQPEQSTFTNPNFFNKLSEEMYRLTEKYPNSDVIMGGDWNARMGRNQDTILFGIDKNDHISFKLDNIPQRRSKDTITNKYGEKLLEFIKGQDVVVLNGRAKSDNKGEFTFVSQNGASVVDYCVVSNSLWGSVDMRVGDISESQHFPLELKMKNVFEKCIKNPPKGMPLKIFKWDKNRADTFVNEMNTLETDFYLRGMKGRLEAGDINNAINIMQKWLEYLGSEMEITEKKRKAAISKGRPVWFDCECKNKKIEMKQKLRDMRRNREQIFVDAYLSSRKEYKKLCNTKKADNDLLFIEKVNEAVNERNDKRIWELIRTKKRVMDNNDIDPDAWVKHYQNLYGEEQEGFMDVSDVAVNESNVILDREISVSDVMLVLSILKNGKAGGLDGIINEFVSAAAKYSFVFIEFLTNLFNQLQTNKIFPQKWVTGVICNIYKGKGEINNPDNYRGITLTPSLSKIYTKILSIRIKEWAENENIISKFQAGFRGGFEAMDNLLVIKTLINKTLKTKRNKLYCAFIDFEKAFDKIDRNILWNKLSKLKMSTHMISILKSIYKETTCCVRIDRFFATETFKTYKGLRQGCELSAILFILFINDLPDCLDNFETFSPCIKGQEVKILLYADDVALFSQSIGGMKRSLAAIENYCVTWEMTINVKKTKVLRVCQGRKYNRNEVFRINGNLIENVSSFQYLGVMIAYNGSWKLHQNEMITKASRALMILRKFIYKYEQFPVSLILKMFNSIITPILTYGREVWGIEGCSKELVSFTYNFYKELLGVSKSTPNCAIDLELGVMPIEGFVLQHAINFYFRVAFSNKALQKSCMQGEWDSIIKAKLCELGLNLNEMQEGSYKRVQKLIKSKVSDLCLVNTLAEAKTKNSLEFFMMLNHYDRGAMYIDIANRSERRMLANFRMYRFGWENRRINTNGEKICVLCGWGIESIRHMIEHCQGTEGKEREGISQRGYENAMAMLEVNSKEDIRAICDYLDLIIKKRKANL